MQAFLVLIRVRDVCSASQRSGIVGSSSLTSSVHSTHGIIYFLPRQTSSGSPHSVSSSVRNTPLVVSVGGGGPPPSRPHDFGACFSSVLISRSNIPPADNLFCGLTGAGFEEMCRLHLFLILSLSSVLSLWFFGSATCPLGVLLCGSTPERALEEQQTQD